MKTLAFILSVLLVITVVQGINRERLQNFMNYLKECSEEKGQTVDSPTAEVLLCASKKDGNLVNDNGEYISNEILRGYSDAISDPKKLEEAQKIEQECDAKVKQSGVTGPDSALKMSECNLPALLLFDKL